jgi:hypothetical protein
MTELGERFLLALADQGYGLVITEEDVIILGSDRKTRHHIPVELFEEPELDLLLRVAIVAFGLTDPGFVWGGEAGGREPGRN